MQKNKKVILLLSLIAVAAVVAALYVKQSRHTPAYPASSQTDQERLRAAENKAPATDPKTDTEAYRRDQEAKTQSAVTPNKANIYISSLSQDDNKVYVGAIVDNQTSGTCTATFSTAQSSFTRTAPLALVTTYYACQGFNVDKSVFPSRGSWNVRVDFKNSDSAGSSETKSITLN